MKLELDFKEEVQMKRALLQRRKYLLGFKNPDNKRMMAPKVAVVEGMLDRIVPNWKETLLDD